jgi:hypothetical protein
MHLRAWSGVVYRNPSVCIPGKIRAKVHACAPRDLEAQHHAPTPTVRPRIEEKKKKNARATWYSHVRYMMVEESRCNSKKERKR